MANLVISNFKPSICVDCGARIGHAAVRCSYCAARERARHH